LRGLSSAVSLVEYGFTISALMSGHFVEQMSDQKIVSLLPSATEIVCAIGLQDRLVGVTHECDFPVGVSRLPHLTASRISHESMTSAEIDHAVRSNLDGHGSIYELDEDLLGELDPDLILTQELCEVCAVSYATVRKAARQFTAGATVVSLEPNTIEEILENILAVGELTHEEHTASSVVRSLRSRLDRLAETTNTLTERPTVMMLEWLEPPFAPGHWVPEQVRIAGGIPSMGEPGKKSVTTTFAEVRESNAEILVLIPCGFTTGDILEQLGRTVFPEEFASLPAIAGGNIWALDASAYFSRPGPRVVDGAEILSRILHPAVFGEPGPDEAVKVDPSRLRFSRATTL